MHKATAVVASVGLGAALVVGAAGLVSAQESDPGGGGWRTEFVCAHLTEIQKQQADHLQLVTGNLTLLGEAKTDAQQHGDTKAVDRLTRRIDRATQRQTRITNRQQKLTDFAAEHCTG